MFYNAKQKEVKQNLIQSFFFFFKKIFYWLFFEKGIIWFWFNFKFHNKIHRISVRLSQAEELWSWTWCADGERLFWETFLFCLDWLDVMSFPVLWMMAMW